MIYRIRKSWSDAKSQIGAYTILRNAVLYCKENYNIYDANGQLIYFYPKPLGNTCPYEKTKRTLRKGCRGEDVKWLQWQLTNLGYYCGIAGIDGDFGNGTYKGVETYQIAYGLDVDGIVGPQTIQSLTKNGKPSEESQVDPQQPVNGFKARLTIPEKGNPYYNSLAAGGYAVGTIKGNPLQNGLDVLSNCVGYAAARFNEIIGKGKWVYLTYPPNAEDFIDAARAQGLEISQTPSLGSIIVWAKGKTHNSYDGAGHVAVVESIEYDAAGRVKIITTSESGYGCATPFWVSRRSNDGNWGGGVAYRFIGFIKNPSMG